MLTSTALIAAMAFAPGQGGLTLSNARVTFGELGSTRPDVKFLPNDIFFISFDIDGIKIDENGRVRYSMAMEVVDKDNKVIFKQQPIDREDFVPLGGSKLPARAFVTLMPDQTDGAYTCRVTVTDRSTKASQTIEQKFEVLKKDFGIVVVYTSADGKGEIPTPQIGAAGQLIFVHFAVCGFSRDAKTKQPNVTVEMVVLARDGGATLPKPSTFTVDREVAQTDTVIPLRSALPLNRAGDFTVELKAVDNVSKGKPVKVSFPIRVVPTN